MLILSLYGCVRDFVDEKLQIKNSTNHTIYVMFSKNKSIDNLELLTYNTENPKEMFTTEIQSNTTEIMRMDGKTFWKDFVEHSNNELNVFVISDSIYKTKRWDLIKSQKLYQLKVIKLSELNKTNWLVEIKE